MKKVIGLITLFIMTQGALATTSQLLEYTYTPKIKGGLVQHSLVVNSDGSVVHRDISPYVPADKATTNVLTLKTANVDKIKDYIRNATPVVISYQESNVKCIITATHTQKFVAADGAIFLKEGAACDGGWRINKNAKALQLAAVLSTLEMAHHKKANLAETESKLDELLK